MEQLIALAGFILIFALAMWRNLHMGAAGLAIAYFLGTMYFGLETPDVSRGFPGQLVITLIGVTYFFGIGRLNGTVDQVVDTLVAAVRGRLVLLPWVFFILAASISASGALTVAVLSILTPIGMAFARSQKINPVLMGLAIVNGTNAGGFSPVAVYYVILSSLFGDSGITLDPLPMFLWTFVGSFLANIVAFFLFGGRSLIGARATMPADADGSIPGAVAPRWTNIQKLTLGIMVMIIILALGFGHDVGYLAITGALILASLRPEDAQAGLQQIGWGVVLLIGGMVTYVNMLDSAGVITTIADQFASIGSPLIAALLLLWISALVTAFASSNAMFVVLAPLSAPLLIQGDIPALGFAIALAVSVVTSDASPFSTAGALVVANAEEHRRDRVYATLMKWAFVIIALIPVLSWLIFVVAAG